MGTNTGRGLLGRISECAQLERLLASARGGQSGVLVIRGDAGIGKTALLSYAAEQTLDFRVAQIAGVEAEMELPFAAVHQLCAPILAHLEVLPEPQRNALSVALGVAAGDTPDRFLVALAVLNLLSAAAEEQPLACIVEDAQWLDEASSQVLGFVARRLLAERIALIFAARDSPSRREFVGLPELRLEGLDPEDARDLLATAIPGRLDSRIRDRIIAETRGNPLALLELPRGLSVAQLAGGFGLPPMAPLSGRIEESFRRRLAQLPPETRRLLLLAAAEPLGEPALMWRAAAGLGIPVTALEPATQSGLVDVGAEVRFRHPLVRSAVYRSASEQGRQMAHRGLAEATDAELAPDRRAWHRAYAARAPDDDVAAELERSAGRAQARGGLAAAAAFLGRSADLTIDMDRRAERVLAAAQLNLQAGAFDTALALLARAQAGPLDELGRARVDLLHAQLAFAQNRGNDAPQLLLRAAKTLEGLDVRMARETYLDAWSAALFAGGLATTAGLLDVSRAAIAAPDLESAPRPCDLLLDGFALVFTEGRAAGAPVLDRAAKRFATAEASEVEVLRWAWLATVAAVYVWDYDTCLAVATREVEVARSSGALEVLAVGLNILTQAFCLGGDYASAELLVAEADAVREATGALVAPYGALVLAGFRGREAAAAQLIEATIREATPGGQGTAVQFAHFSNAVVMNGLGRYDEALPSAVAAIENTPELVVAIWSRSEAIEAASRTQETEVAERALAELAEQTHGSDADWGLGMVARGRALLSQGEAAERSFREAIERLSRTKLRPDMARARLLYGEWLRREGRRSDAREQLRPAHEMLADMGMDAFAERARRELAATGETVRKRRDDTRNELTPQELQIAQLARDGLSNLAIGARLFLSPRTVEWHLHKVFTKLGIRSRRELHGALDAPGRVTGASGTAITSSST
jgi:DNA-binding CsgD family transcriptional regulator